MLGLLGQWLEFCHTVSLIKSNREHWIISDTTEWTLTDNTEADGILVVSITGSQSVDDGPGLGVGRQHDGPHVGTQVEDWLGPS